MDTFSVSPSLFPSFYYTELSFTPSHLSSPSVAVCHLPAAGCSWLVRCGWNLEFGSWKFVVMKLWIFLFSFLLTISFCCAFFPVLQLRRKVWALSWVMIFSILYHCNDDDDADDDDDDESKMKKWKREKGSGLEKNSFMTPYHS